MSPKYYLTWRNKFLTTDAETIDDMIDGLEAAVEDLRAMRSAGVVLEGGAEDDYAHFFTSDPAVAKRFGFEEEEEFEEDYLEEENFS
ncbi:hypothetical protein [Kamptonema formosum]|uniref:hypothetical protein n=1 Tax=Kamptonema formosum TaxID=331992 RepID=UPI0003450D7F|nr:hypothetical protein [Oscillatoria sp. PCC 10802]